MERSFHCLHDLVLDMLGDQTKPEDLWSIESENYISHSDAKKSFVVRFIHICKRI